MPDKAKKMEKRILEIRDLTVSYKEKPALKNFSYSFAPGMCYAILGASGSGKTTLIKAIDFLLPEYAKTYGLIKLNSIILNKDNIASMRGRNISYIVQDPISYFNPVYTLYQQLDRSSFLLDRSLDKKKRRELSKEALKFAGLDECAGNLYPHEASGGMLSRAEIAVAYIEKANLILLDEPTAGLDDKTEKLVLSSLRKLAKDNNSILIYISHSLDAVRGYSDECIILKDGVIQESGKTERIFSQSQSEYGKALISAYHLGGVDA